MAALSSFALSVLSVEQALERHPWQRCDSTPVDGSSTTAMVAATTCTAVTRPTRTSRRATSHFNTFQTSCSTDDSAPPSYSTTIRQRVACKRPEEGCEALPSYSCSVTAEAKVLLNLELINPLHSVSMSEWREVYLVVRGTMLNVHKIKDGGMGKLLRSYTLQHAEVGLAVDTAHAVLIPNTKLAHLIPSPARQKAFKKDPRLFTRQKQHLLRLRVEMDQLIFAQPSEQATHALCDAISAAIDIAQPLDERSMTKQCTVPRRRRRPRVQFTGDVEDPALVAEQDRLLRSLYPAFSERSGTSAVPTTSRDEDEIDVSALREDSGPRAARPAMLRSSTQDSVESRASESVLLTTDSANLDAAGKWQPQHTRSDEQTLRYTRRCMPVLLAEAPRASDVLICKGRRVRINRRHESLDDWELKPPSYKAHGFEPKKPELERSISTASTVSDNRSSQISSSDDITPLEISLAGLDLQKLTSNDLDKAPTTTVKHRRADVDALTTIPGVVYCF